MKSLAGFCLVCGILVYSCGASVLNGYSQPLEWAEFPLLVDAVMIGTLAAIQFLPPFFRRGFENLYVSSWYIIGGLVFSLMSFPMGLSFRNLYPGLQVPLNWTLDS